MNQKEVKKLIDEYPLLNKPCYIENLNKGQKNLKEFLEPQNLLIILWYMMISLFVMSVN